MRILVVVALVLALALSGCATKKSGDDDDDGTGTSTKTGTGSGGGNGTAFANCAPTASMNANNTGMAPINVTFALNGTDADGDAITWSLDFGDNGTSANGTSLPANVTHLYAAGGLYNASLSVSDGKNTTVVTLALNITGGAPFDQFIASGTPDLPCAQCSEAGANTGVGYRGGLNELDSWFVEIPAAAAGQLFTATSGDDVDLSFRDGCDGGAAIGDPFLAAGDEAGIVPEGALCVLAWNTGAPGETITLTIG